MLTYDSDASPLRPPSARILMPSQEATSGSASKVMEFVGPVPVVCSSPPITSMPAPWEKISTGPRLPSIISVEVLRTTTPGATRGSS